MLRTLRAFWETRAIKDTRDGPFSPHRSRRTFLLSTYETRGDARLCAGSLAEDEGLTCLVVVPSRHVLPGKQEDHAPCAGETGLRGRRETWR